MAKFKLFSDGASRGNPGNAGIGVVIYSAAGEKVLELAEYLGIETNNVAEYKALIRGLEEAIELGGTEVEVFADSELMVKQMKGQYKVKNPGLQPLYQKAKALSLQLNSFQITHVLREKNKEADALANQGIEQKGASKKLLIDKDKALNKAEATTAFKMPSLKQDQESVTSSEILASGEYLILRRIRLAKGKMLSKTISEEKMLYLLKGKIEVIFDNQIIQLQQDQTMVLQKNKVYNIKALEESVILGNSLLRKNDKITKV